MIDTLRWHVVARDGELVAVTRFAVDAAKLAISDGLGATVRHDGQRLVLTVTDELIAEGALPLADAMIAVAYRKPAT